MLLLYNIACSLLAVAVVLVGLGHINAGNLFLAKLLGFAGAVMLHQYTAKETYYYFRNAGCRMRRIIALAFMVDFLLLIIFFLLIALTTHAATYFKG